MRQTSFAQIRSEDVKQNSPPVKKIKSAGESVFRFILFISTAMVAAIVVITIYKAHSYYLSPITERYRSELHQQFKPGGTIGHPLGMVGSGLLIALISYSFRKRIHFLKHLGPLSRWLEFHIFCGTAGPLLIFLHTSLKMRGIVAISFWSMVVVFLSGVIGRYLYAQIPHAISGKELQYQDLSNEISDINRQLEFMMEPGQFNQVQAITDFQVRNTRLTAINSILLIIADDFRWIKQRRALKAILKKATAVSDEDRKKITGLLRHRKLQMRRISLLKTSHELFRHWHVIHLPLAQTMYLTMAIHIVVAVMTGYF